jgi:hypothetical protein
MTRLYPCTLEQPGLINVLGRQCLAALPWDGCKWIFYTNGSYACLW